MSPSNPPIPNREPDHVHANNLEIVGACFWFEEMICSFRTSTETCSEYIYIDEYDDSLKRKDNHLDYLDTIQKAYRLWLKHKQADTALLEDLADSK